MDNMLDKTFWSRRVLVTGGGGFLGAHIVDRLHRLGGAIVFAPRSDQYDLRREVDVIRLYQETRPEIVIHCAAVVGGIGANRRRPADFFYDNLKMGLQTMHHAWRSGVKKFVALGAVCAYPKFTSLPFCEEDLWNGYPEETNAPYGLAKRMLLVQAQTYRQQYAFNAIYLLPVNLYGPGDNFDLETGHVIPALIRKCLEAKRCGAPQIVVWGDGTSTREFLYVTDAVEGILLAAQHYDEPNPVNLGSGFEISIDRLAQTIAHEVGFGGRIVWDTSKPNGQPRRKIDTSRAQRLFGFRSQTDFRTGLRQTIDWYRRQQT
jgi:GDP-L-fucose synthase